MALVFYFVVALEQLLLKTAGKYCIGDSVSC